MFRSSHGGAAETNPTSNHEIAGSIPDLAQWVKDHRYGELWCKSQMWLGSGLDVAVGEAGSYCSNWTSSLGTSICCGCGPKKTNKTKQPRKKL